MFLKKYTKTNKLSKILLIITYNIKQLLLVTTFLNSIKTESYKVYLINSLVRNSKLEINYKVYL